MTSIVLATNSAAFEQKVRRALGGELNGSLRRWHSEVMFLDSLAAVKELAADAPDVVAIGPNVAVELALEVTRVIEDERPEIAVVLVAEPTPDLWEQALRAGVRDVLTPDASDEAIRGTFAKLTETVARRKHNLAVEAGVESTHGKVITVMAPKGGAGKTALSTNLAVVLSAAGEGRVALVDFDLQFGDVGNALGLQPEHTIGDLSAVPGGVTPTTLKVFLTRRDDNLFAMCAPDSPAEGEDIPELVVDKTVRLLSEDFEFVVIDTSAGLSEATLAAVELSTDLIFLCDLSVSALRGLRKEIDALDALGIDHPNRHFVLNRADSRVGIEVEEAAALVGMPIDVQIPSSRAVPLAMNRGIPVVEDSARSAVARAFEDVAGRFLPEPTESKRGLFRRDR